MKGEFSDVAHRDGTFGFTEYAYAVVTTQPNVPRTIKEAQATPEAAQWNAAAEREIASFKDRQVDKLFRAMPFPLEGSESIRNGCSSARRAAPSRLV